MIKVISTVILSAMLAACASNPLVQTETVAVEVPIYIPCAAKIPVAPTYNFPKVQLLDDIYDKVKALLADRKLSDGYEFELVAALKSCT